MSHGHLQDRDDSSLKNAMHSADTRAARQSEHLSNHFTSAKQFKEDEDDFRESHYLQHGNHKAKLNNDNFNRDNIKSRH